MKLTATRWAKCSQCNYSTIYTFRADYGFIQSCEICGSSLNKVGA